MRSVKNSMMVLSICGLSACGPGTEAFKNLTTESTAADEVNQSLNRSAFDVNLHPLYKEVCNPFGGGGSVSPEKGILAMLFYVGAGGAPLNSAAQYPERATRSRQKLFFNDINVPTRMFTEGFSTQTSEVVKNDLGERLIEWFGIQFQTSLRLAPNMEEGDYELSSLADDGVVVKAKIDGQWKTIINNDGTHPTRMGCGPTLLHMTRESLIPLDITYYQGPRMHISNVLMWKKSNANSAGRDPACGQTGNSLFFDPDNHSRPLQPYQDLLSRGWAPISADSFFIPMEESYNPCVVGTNPVISQFAVNEVFSTGASVTWTTDIAATSQVLITNVATGEQTVTTSDNVLRTSHSLKLLGLTAGTTYHLQAVSISGDLGKALGPVLTLVTLE